MMDWYIKLYVPKTLPSILRLEPKDRKVYYSAVRQCLYDACPAWTEKRYIGCCFGILAGIVAPTWSARLGQVTSSKVCVTVVQS